MDWHISDNIKRPITAINIIGAVYIAFILLSFGLFVLSIMTGKTEIPLLILTFIILVPFFIGRYAVNGLKQGRKSGWITAFVLCSLMLSSIVMFPAGIYGITGLLKKDVRDHYLD